jgi:hypothetical protein
MATPALFSSDPGHACQCHVPKKLSSCSDEDRDEDENDNFLFSEIIFEFFFRPK